MVGEEPRKKEGNSEDLDELDDLDGLAKLHMAKVANPTSSSVTAPTEKKEPKPKKKEEDSEPKVKEKKLPEDDSFKDILYGEISDATINRYCFTMPSVLIDELDEVLKTLPAGFKSSKSQVLASLLKQFLDKYKESVVSFGKDMDRLRREMEEYKKK